MNSKTINEIDFYNRIETLQNSYNQVQACKNFLADAPSEIREHIGEIQKITNPDLDDNHMFHSLKKVIADSHATILIECYTISEQMLKNTKYQILNFDETENSEIQKFLEFKINPSKFSPRPKIQEINNFFKRYGGNKLFISKADIYDSMIDKRNRYAHQGICDFDLLTVPKTLEFLKYLEFEYRMFLQKNCWSTFFKEICSIEISGGKREDKEQNYQRKKTILIKEIPKLKKLIQEESNIVTTSLEPIFDMITNNENYKTIYSEFSNKKNYFKSYFETY